MAYIYGFIVVGLFFAALHYFTNLTFSQKWSVITTALAIIAIAIMFNSYQDEVNKHTRDVVKKFNQGEVIICDEVKITNKNYTLSLGTHTFIAKKESVNKGEMFSASECDYNVLK